MLKQLPNMLTLGRLCLVPLTVWLILSAQWSWAFAMFALAGLSDGLDGFIAKHYDMKTELGAWLDPLADKALLVCLFISLAAVSLLPLWLTILVVSRDLMIVSGVVLAMLMARGMEIRPLMVSKANTAAQIVLVGFVLAAKAGGIVMPNLRDLLIGLVTALTLASLLAYLRPWLRHMSH
ncbi:MAG: CDP-alcohol phosphatidyltransferase family protein [Hyphomicrobiales bacterium]|nr:CDP-alcohol phosphatidyltransferase family protein [Hyphomicrobiales bacterium]